LAWRQSPLAAINVLLEISPRIRQTENGGLCFQKPPTADRFSFEHEESLPFLRLFFICRMAVLSYITS
jgi:hypothetical protein